MAGVNTFLRGEHATRRAGIVPPLRLTAAQRRAFAQVIGERPQRKLRPKLADFRQTLAVYRDMREATLDVVTRQDTIRSLSALAGLPSEAAALDALDRIDACSEGTVRAELYLQGHRGEPLDVRGAARAALVKQRAFRVAGGRGALGYRRLAVGWAWEIWCNAGRDPRIWSQGATTDRKASGSPLVRWIAEVLEAIEGAPVQPREAARLLDAVRKARR